LTRIFTSIILVLFMLSIPLILSPSVTYACSCAPPPSVEEELERKTAVFSGKVIDISGPNKRIFKSSADPVTVLLEVDTIWKGINESQVIVHTAESSASCGFKFELGKEYLVYAYGDKGDLQTGLCERTTLLTSAAEDLSILGKGKTPSEQVNLQQQDQMISSTIWILAVTLFIAVIVIIIILRKGKSR
jgi:hypothetical protein